MPDGYTEVAGVKFTVNPDGELVADDRDLDAVLIDDALEQVRALLNLVVDALND